MVAHKNNSWMTSEPASLGSGSGSLKRRNAKATIAVLMATVMTALGVTTWVTGAQAAQESVQPTSTSANVEVSVRVGMPTEMKVTALNSFANENIRQVRLNRVAKKKHEVRVTRSKIVKTAKAQIGDPYRAGHSGPNAFDCSGLVRFVYKQVTGKTLPHYSKAQYKHVRKISKKEAQPGDLVFFFRNGAHHVGIYIGNGKMIDAPNAGKSVRVSPITGSWWGRSYTGMGRILPA